MAAGRAGRAAVPFCSSPGWEVVQSVGLQTLNLAILVRVQASQPNDPNTAGKRSLIHLAIFEA